MHLCERPFLASQLEFFRNNKFHHLTLSVSTDLHIVLYVCLQKLCLIKRYLIASQYGAFAYKAVVWPKIAEPMTPLLAGICYSRYKLEMQQLIAKCMKVGLVSSALPTAYCRTALKYMHLVSLMLEAVWFLPFYSAPLGLCIAGASLYCTICYTSFQENDDCYYHAQTLSRWTTQAACVSTVLQLK